MKRRIIVKKTQAIDCPASVDTQIQSNLQMKSSENNLIDSQNACVKTILQKQDQDSFEFISKENFQEQNLKQNENKSKQQQFPQEENKIDIKILSQKEQQQQIKSKMDSQQSFTSQSKIEKVCKEKEQKKEKKSSEINTQFLHAQNKEQLKNEYFNNIKSFYREGQFKGQHSIQFENQIKKDLETERNQQDCLNKLQNNKQKQLNQVNQVMSHLKSLNIQVQPFNFKDKPNEKQYHQVQNNQEAKNNIDNSFSSILCQQQNMNVADYSLNKSFQQINELQNKQNLSFIDESTKKIHKSRDFCKSQVNSIKEQITQKNKNLHHFSYAEEEEHQKNIQKKDNLIKPLIDQQQQLRDVNQLPNETLCQQAHDQINKSIVIVNDNINSFEQISQNSLVNPFQLQVNPSVPSQPISIIEGVCKESQKQSASNLDRLMDKLIQLNDQKNDLSQIASELQGNSQQTNQFNNNVNIVDLENTQHQRNIQDQFQLNHIQQNQIIQQVRQLVQGTKDEIELNAENKQVEVIQLLSSKSIELIEEEKIEEKKIQSSEQTQQLSLLEKRAAMEQDIKKINHLVKSLGKKKLSLLKQRDRKILQLKNYLIRQINSIDYILIHEQIQQEKQLLLQKQAEQQRLQQEQFKQQMEYYSKIITFKRKFFQDQLQKCEFIVLNELDFDSFVLEQNKIQSSQQKQVSMQSEESDKSESQKEELEQSNKSEIFKQEKEQTENSENQKKDINQELIEEEEKEISKSDNQECIQSDLNSKQDNTELISYQPSQNDQIQINQQEEKMDIEQQQINQQDMIIEEEKISENINELDKVKDNQNLQVTNKIVKNEADQNINSSSPVSTQQSSTQLDPIIQSPPQIDAQNQQYDSIVQNNIELELSTLVQAEKKNNQQINHLSDFSQIFSPQIGLIEENLNALEKSAQITKIIEVNNEKQLSPESNDKSKNSIEFIVVDDLFEPENKSQLQQQNININVKCNKIEQFIQPIELEEIKNKPLRTQQAIIDEIFYNCSNNLNKAVINKPQEQILLEKPIIQEKKPERKKRMKMKEANMQLIIAFIRICNQIGYSGYNSYFRLQQDINGEFEQPLLQQQQQQQLLQQHQNNNLTLSTQPKQNSFLSHKQQNQEFQQEILQNTFQNYQNYFNQKINQQQQQQQFSKQIEAQQQQKQQQTYVNQQLENISQKLDQSFSQEKSMKIVKLKNFILKKSSEQNVSQKIELSINNIPKVNLNEKQSIKIEEDQLNQKYSSNQNNTGKFFLQKFKIIKK